jgi:hypothetical protein
VGFLRRLRWKGLVRCRYARQPAMNTEYGVVGRSNVEELRIFLCSGGADVLVNKGLSWLLRQSDGNPHPLTRALILSLGLFACEVRLLLPPPWLVMLLQLCSFSGSSVSDSAGVCCHTCIGCRWHAPFISQSLRRGCNIRSATGVKPNPS